MSGIVKKVGGDDHLRVLALRKFLKLSFQLFCYLYPVIGTSIFYNRLDDTAGVVLEYDILYLSSYYIHKSADMFRTLFF